MNVALRPGLIVSAVAAVVVLMPFQSADAGVVGLWTFDEYAANSSIASDRVVLDQSGNDRHLRALLNPNTIVGPSGTTAVFLNGSGSRFEFQLGYTGNDAASTSQTASSSDINFDTLGPALGSFTIEMVVQLPHNPDGVGGVGAEGGILGKGDASVSGQDQWHVNAINNGGSHPNTIEWLQADTDATPVTLNTNVQNISLDWHHLAIVRDRSLDTVRIYIDGVEEQLVSGSTTNGNLDNVVGDFVIGARGSGSNKYFRGGIDLVKISDEVLAPEDFVPIPEPSMGMLLLAGALCLIPRRNRG